ncbi:hypothetical protein KAT92_03145 [Candidatus Babeliales bacterium]|nr:hypothetical protein [Candidatus Babeliales bacterium]
MMINVRFLRVFLLSISFISSIFVCRSAQDENNAFIESFIRYYDFTSVGRYTHEYHPFLFEKSSYSLDELENSLTKNGLAIKGRIVVAGYEEQAVPGYYTNYRICTGSKINDEARARGLSGWGEQLHNKFGLMSGFLFRDVPRINQQLEAIGRSTKFEHINLNFMSIYDDDASVFQSHAFGDLFPFMLQTERIINQQVLNNNDKAVFAGLINFWQNMYRYEIKYGNRKVLGTQDVLFSIAHAQHLLRSPAPLFKYYVGPDITYPIKVTRVQKVAATRHAQAFVKRFVKDLKSVDNKKTAYIFCSFVDGVGKSTLLGNVQNYQKYDNQFSKYEAVDNSSSQLAQLYEYEKDVFIADLPAQMSHFTYKPDGMVYFDVLAAGISDQAHEDLQAFVLKNKEELLDKWEKAVLSVAGVVVRDGWFESSLQDAKNPERAFARNLFLLKKNKENNWIPFSCDGHDYLFNRQKPDQIRLLVKLELADSIGLKNYAPEQMLFLEGLRFPLPYDVFINDLVERLRERGIENIVFVDFLSMYPRSSRENIRVNYLLEQLSLLFDDFDITKSSYATFVNDAHLLHALNSGGDRQILQAFEHESLTRLALYSVMQEKKSDTVDGIGLEEMSLLLRDKIKSFTRELRDKTHLLAAEKIKKEASLLELVHGKTKNYLNIQELNFDGLLAFSYLLQDIFENLIDNEQLQALWAKPGKLTLDCNDLDGFVDKPVTLDSGDDVRLLYVVSPESKSETELTPILRHLRMSWYAALGNLVGGVSVDGKIKIENARFFVAPIWLQKTIDGKIAVLRKDFETWDEQLPDEALDFVNLLHGSRGEPLDWGKHEDVPLLLAANRAQTNAGLFAFGYNAGNSGRHRLPGCDSLVSYFMREFKEKSKPELVVTATDLWEKFKSDRLWKKYDFARVLKSARKNSDPASAKPTAGREKKKKNSFHSNDQYRGRKSHDVKKHILLGTPEQVESSRFVVRALATLEMVLKDPNGDIAVRRGDKKDFAAALKLFEKIVLPSYFDIVFEDDLFDDYYSAELALTGC